MNTTYDIGPVMNVNAMMQEHLDKGGKLELVVTTKGADFLDWLPSDAMVQELKEKLEG